MTDIEILEFMVGTVLGLILGIGGTVIKVNSTYDNDIRNKTNASIDNAVRDVCAYFEDPTRNSNQIMDYSVGSLVSDVRLKPIIGSSIYDGNFAELKSDLFTASAQNPSELSEEQLTNHIKNINSLGVKLKRVVQIHSGQLRLFRKR